MNYLLLAFTLFCTNVAQAITIPLASYHIPGLLSKDKQGPMMELLNAIERHSKLKFELTIMPVRRVQYGFRQEIIQGYFPELEDFQPENSCRSTAFMQKAIVAITRIDDQLITDVGQLHGRTIGAVSGFSYGKNIIENPAINIERVDNEQMNIKKLMSGRIDAIIGDRHSTINAIKREKLEDKVRFDVNHPINLLDVFFVFHTDVTGENRCTYVSEALAVLRKKGTLKRLFEAQGQSK